MDTELVGAAGARTQGHTGAVAGAGQHAPGGDGGLAVDGIVNLARAIVEVDPQG
jgi:hypothetical protein